MGSLQERVCLSEQSSGPLSAVFLPFVFPPGQGPSLEMPGDPAKVTQWAPGAQQGSPTGAIFLMNRGLLSAAQ